MEPIDFYTDEELSIAKEIIFDVTIGIYTLYQSDTPVGILLGGQPASGKTGLIKLLQKAYQDRKFVVINGDEYRQYHPNARQIHETLGRDASQYTQSFSNALVEYLKAECLRLRCNFVIEGTMRTYDVIERTALAIRKAGFRCEAHVLAIARDDSLLGLFQRYEGDKQRTGAGRFRRSLYTMKRISKCLNILLKPVGTIYLIESFCTRDYVTGN